MASVTLSDPFEDILASSPPQTNNDPKNWLEIQNSLRRARKTGCQVFNRIPHSFTFRNIETELGIVHRIYFLGVPPGNREQSILYVDIPPDINGDNIDILEWKPMIDSFQATAFSQFSKEEQLLRERKRLGSLGITSYEVDIKSGRFAFPAANSLYYCTDTSASSAINTESLHPKEATVDSTNTRLDVKLCPHNEDLMAYISTNDLYVYSIKTGTECRLSYANNGSDKIRENFRSVGVPSFVMQEEFDRYTGYWWQPKTGNSKTYRILYEEVDESEVEILTISSYSGDGEDEYRYPKAGSANAKSTLKLVEINVDESGNIYNRREKQLVESLHSLFPDYEYLVRAGWTRDGHFVHCQLLDRQQQQLRLVLIPLESFSVELDSDQEDIEMGDQVSTVTSPIQVIYQDINRIWINVSDVLHFFPQTDPSKISFIWSSEKSGYNHLYLVTSAVQTVINNSQTNLRDELQPQILSEVQLTKGDWAVQSKQIWVDEVRNLVYFIGFKDTPLETHLYVVSCENPKEPRRLTTTGQSHNISMDSKCEMFTTVCSKINPPPVCTLCRLVFSEEEPTHTQQLAHILGPAVVNEGYISPELFHFENHQGDTIHGMVYTPSGYTENPDTKYPTVLYVYGGPQLQLVANAFKGVRCLRLQMLAAMGYAVVAIDNRGSCNRGLVFESSIKRRLGKAEIEDLVEGLHHIAGVKPFIDLDRVAIHGWSYGGYLSLMGIAKRPDIFKVAIAGAPVTSWNLYDTAYTERYLDTPSNNSDGYRDSGVLRYVKDFPSEENRVLLVHGLIDENVHFKHTMLLISELIKACKPYNLLVYPNERHGIRNPDNSEHYDTSVLSYLQQHL